MVGITPVKKASQVKEHLEGWTKEKSVSPIPEASREGTALREVAFVHREEDATSLADIEVE
jgi:hypothetical protein